MSEARWEDLYFNGVMSHNVPDDPARAQALLKIYEDAEAAAADEHPTDQPGGGQ